MIPLSISGGGAVGVPNPETALAVATLILGTTAAFLRFRQVGWWERPAALLARRRPAALLSICAAPLLLRALLLPWHPVPEPRVHDEFSLLLAADTFAHGRLVNPQHPFWPHFESMHILSRPVYASAFPVAPAAVLAAGQAFFGHPWIGVWLSVGLMCGAFFWMLEGSLPPRWALLGAFLVVIRLSVSSYWMNSYWGGAVAATGGALVLGALPRIRRQARPLHGFVLGAGLAILANSRPFEGAVFGLAAAAILLLPTPRPAMLRRALLPAILVLAFAAAGMGLYFASVTGRPWLPPYVLYRSAMSSAPHFVFQSPRPEPFYNNREMRFFYSGWEIHHYLRARRAPLSDLSGKFGAYWRFYLGPLLTIPLLALPTLRKNRDARRLLLLAAVFSLSLAVQVWHNAHYAAPAAGLLLLIAMLSLRRLRLLHWRRRPVGLYLVRCLPAACVALLLIQTGTAAREPGGPDAAGAGWRWPADRSPRASLLEQLERAGGRHLVFIRYGIPHDPGDEWAYNAAEIDASKVVWARELDPASNAALMRYFADRRVWLVEPDQPAPRLIPHSEAVPRPMPFVPIGAPGIAVIRSAPELRRLLQSRIRPEDATLRTCDSWNRLFTASTGVGPPADRSGCGDPTRRVTFERRFNATGVDRPADRSGCADPARPVTFEHWFAWLCRKDMDGFAQQ